MEYLVSHVVWDTRLNGDRPGHIIGSGSFTRTWCYLFFKDSSNGLLEKIAPHGIDKLYIRLSLIH